MVLKIRMRQQGRANRQTYRLVVTDIRNPRDGKYLEMLGWYNPYNQKTDSEIDIARVQHWLGLGAQMSPNVQMLIARIAPEVMKQIQTKQQARRLKEVQKRKAVKRAAKEKKATANKGS